MKLKPLFAVIIAAIALSSCAEKTFDCKLDHENTNGELSVQYTYDGNNIVKQEYIDTSGQWAAKNIYSFGSNGVIDTTFFYYGEADTLGYANYIFATSGKIDSLQQWYDSDLNNIADQYGRTWIYTYSGDKVISIEQRIDGIVPQLYATFTWNGNNLVENRNANTGKYYTYTYSDVKNPYYQYLYYQDFCGDGSSAPASEFLVNQRHQYDSLDVLLTTTNYQPSNITDGVEIYYPGNGTTQTIKFACTEH
jgi:hypothetical protein